MHAQSVCTRPSLLAEGLGTRLDLNLILYTVVYNIVWSRAKSIKRERERERTKRWSFKAMCAFSLCTVHLPGTVFHLLDAITGDPLGGSRQKVEVREVR